jgi:ribosomal protein L11 methylase PrmA
VVVANILAPVLIELAPALMQLRANDGVMVLAGLVDQQVDRVVHAFTPLQVLTVIHDGVWRGLLLGAPADTTRA